MSGCPVPPNTDPRRSIPYCPPTPSRSEPLSHAEYLRRLKANNNGALSSPNTMLQVGTGIYARTIWTESPSTNECSTNKVLPPVPEVHPRSTAIEAGMNTMMKGAAAARGTLSKYDTTNRNEWNTTYRRQGIAINNDIALKIQNTEGKELCADCSLSGTNEVVPGNPNCKC